MSSRLNEKILVKIVAFFIMLIYIFQATKNAEGDG